MKRFFHKLSVFAASFIGAALALLLVSGVCYALIVNGNLTLAANSGSGEIIFQSGGLTTRGKVMSTGSWNLQNGALATNATDGFVYLPSSAGTPAGTPTTISGGVPWEVDTTGHLAYMYENSTWKLVGPLTAGSNITISAAGVIAASGSGSKTWLQQALDDCKGYLSLTDGAYTYYYQGFATTPDFAYSASVGTITMGSARNGVLKHTGTNNQQMNLSAISNAVGGRPTIAQINQSWCARSRVKMVKGSATAASCYHALVSASYDVLWGVLSSGSYNIDKFTFQLHGQGGTTALASIGTRDSSYHNLTIYFTSGDSLLHYDVDGTGTSSNVSSQIGSATDTLYFNANDTWTSGVADFSTEYDEFVTVTATQ